MFKHLVFVVYPSYPPQIGSAIDDAMEILKAPPYNQHIETWREIESPGHFIVEGILDRIDASHYVVADITHLNFNVTFEVGYAIGRSKRVILIINKAFTPAAKEIAQLGVYDTLIHKTYENSKELVEHLSKLSDISPLNFPDYPIDTTAPIYILDTSYKTNAAIRIMSKVKKSRIRFRSFDPKEQPRISALEAYREVKKSIAIIINLLSSLITDSYINNLRGAFLAGLSYGLDKEVLILQDGDEPVPLDYRDFVSVYKRPEEIDPYINELAPRVVEALQTVESRSEKRIEGLLANIDIGATAAENEMYNLGNYYVPTNQFNQALEGLIRIVVGRKGSGKTALFFQTRDNLRAGKHNIILDLKPDGHQLMRFKYVLNLLSEPVMEHFATTFWEYVLLLEITHKLLQIDHIFHKRNHTLFVPYQQLYTLYAKDGRVGEVDFSERMLERVNRI